MLINMMVINCNGLGNQNVFFFISYRVLTTIYIIISPRLSIFFLIHTVNPYDHEYI